jgi:hypothetical protein
MSDGIHFLFVIEMLEMPFTIFSKIVLTFGIVWYYDSAEVNQRTEANRSQTGIQMSLPMKPGWKIKFQPEFWIYAYNSCLQII